MSDNNKEEHGETIAEDIVPDTVKEDTAPTPKPKKVAPVPTPSKVETQIPEGLSVEMSKVVFESLYERNSRSVGLIQIRLVELGYMSAGADKRGFLSNGTRQALEEFAAKKKTGDYDSEETITAVFKGTPVKVIPAG